MTSWKAWFARTHSPTNRALALFSRAFARSVSVSWLKRSSAASSSPSLPVEVRDGKRQSRATPAPHARESLAQLLARQRADAHATIRLELHETERRQATQGLTNRGSRDVVLLGKDSWRRIDPGSISPEMIASSMAYAISSALVDSTVALAPPQLRLPKKMSA